MNQRPTPPNGGIQDGPTKQKHRYVPPGSGRGGGRGAPGRGGRGRGVVGRSSPPQRKSKLPPPPNAAFGLFFGKQSQPTTTTASTPPSKPPNRKPFTNSQPQERTNGGGGGPRPRPVPTGGPRRTNSASFPSAAAAAADRGRKPLQRTKSTPNPVTSHMDRSGHGATSPPTTRRQPHRNSAPNNRKTMRSWSRSPVAEDAFGHGHEGGTGNYIRPSKSHQQTQSPIKRPPPPRRRSSIPDNNHHARNRSPGRQPQRQPLDQSPRRPPRRYKSTPNPETRANTASGNSVYDDGIRVRSSPVLPLKRHNSTPSPRTRPSRNNDKNNNNDDDFDEDEWATVSTAAPPIRIFTPANHGRPDFDDNVSQLGNYSAHGPPPPKYEPFQKNSRNVAPPKRRRLKKTWNGNSNTNNISSGGVGGVNDDNFSSYGSKASRQNDDATCLEPIPDDEEVPACIDVNEDERSSLTNDKKRRSFFSFLSGGGGSDQNKHDSARTGTGTTTSKQEYDADEDVDQGNKPMSARQRSRQVLQEHGKVLGCCLCICTCIFILIFSLILSRKLKRKDSTIDDDDSLPPLIGPNSTTATATADDNITTLIEQGSVLLTSSAPTSSPSAAAVITMTPTAMASSSSPTDAILPYEFIFSPTGDTYFTMMTTSEDEETTVHGHEDTLLVQTGLDTTSNNNGDGGDNVNGSASVTVWPTSYALLSFNVTIPTTSKIISSERIISATLHLTHIPDINTTQQQQESEEEENRSTVRIVHIPTTTVMEQLLDIGNISGNSIEDVIDGDGIAFISSQVDNFIIGPTFNVSRSDTTLEVDITTLLFPEEGGGGGDGLLRRRRRRRMNPSQVENKNGYEQVVLFFMIESLTPKGRPGNRFGSREKQEGTSMTTTNNNTMLPSTTSSSPQLIIYADTRPPTSIPTSSPKPSTSSIPTLAPSILVASTSLPTIVSSSQAPSPITIL